MLDNVKNFIEHNIVSTPPQFEKLTISLRTTKENAGNLD